jgi:hypothetical protein
MINGVPDPAWMICDGRDIDNDGNEDVTDLTHRLIVGAGRDDSAHDVAGQKDTTLAAGNLPAHQHNLNTYTDCGIHAHRYIRNSAADFWIEGLVPTRLSFPGEDFSGTTGLEYHNFKSPLPEDARCVYDPGDGPEPGQRPKITGATGSVGSGSPAENRPPFYAVYLIMKIAP